MARDARFWRNVTIVGLFHLVVLLGFLWWSRTPKRAPKDVVWMEGGAGAKRSDSTAQEPAVTPEVAKEEAAPEVAPTAKSEIELPSSTVSATPTATPTPTPTAKPTPRPIPRPTPKVTPKPKLKPSATPKKKSSPKPTPDEEEEAATKELAKKKAIAKAALAKEKEDQGDAESSEKPVKKGTGTQGTESGEKSSGTSGGHGSGAGGASEFGWYGTMLHDRFYSEWVQPTTVVASGAKLSVLVKIRIQKDGRVSDFGIVRPSGNVVVDDSVQAVAARVKQVDPLPSGLGDDYYDVKINFEFNAGQ
jgi:TonB family protein